MSVWASYASAFRRYGDFQGRTSLGVFWRFFAVNVSVSVGLVMASGLAFAVTGGQSASGQREEPSFLAYAFLVTAILYALAAAIPGLAIEVRRLHDVGRSGWWVLLGLLGIFGLIPLLIWLTREGGGPNDWGPGGPEVDSAPGASGPSATTWSSVASTGRPAAPPVRDAAPVSNLDEVLDRVRPSVSAAGPPQNGGPESGTGDLDHVLGVIDSTRSTDRSVQPAEVTPGGKGAPPDAAHKALRDMINRRIGEG